MFEKYHFLATPATTTRDAMQDDILSNISVDFCTHTAQSIEVSLNYLCKASASIYMRRPYNKIEPTRYAADGGADTV
jgi:hypothetical protein